MIDKFVNVIRNAYSGAAAKEDVATISRHHRIQASPGYRAAAQYVFESLQTAGLEAQMEHYPADYGSRFWTTGSFQEWEATAATLDLVEPADQARPLADYRELKLSLIQRSIPFQGELELVVLDDGTRETDYDGLDVAGKMVLTNGSVERVRQLAVEARGARGILFDGMHTAAPVREAIDLPDARQYTSFWWTGRPEEKQTFGFVLSPRQSVWLRRLIARRAAAGEPPVRVRAHVESRFYDGEFELVSASIPGDRPEAVILVSHLCHPQPSANDNASGAAANLEAARTLARLYANGQLPRPSRTIRFLWMPEMTGSYAFLSRHEALIPRLVAGLNLDMVGADQNQTGSVFLLERPPDATASFAPDLLEWLRELFFDDARSHAGLGAYPLFRYATTGFSGGSDHYIFSDPTVGVPMPMFIQWPDRFYHTSADTLDKVDPVSLARSGSLAAAYAHFVASAGPTETTWLAHEMLARFQGRLTGLVQSHLTACFSDEANGPPDDLERRIAYALDRFQAALQTLERLWDGSEAVAESVYDTATRFARQERERLRAVLPDEDNAVARAGAPANRDVWEQRAATLVPRRLYRGPALTIRALAPLSQAERDSWYALLDGRDGAGTVHVLAEYWADGRRSALEIVERIEMETGIREPELVVRTFELLQKLGLVAFVND